MTDITLKQIPIGEYEYVDVVFNGAHVDTPVKYEKLRVDDVGSVRWVDVTPGGSVTGTVPQVYRAGLTTTAKFGPGYLVLRSTVAGYKTRLLLFTERR